MIDAATAAVSRAVAAGPEASSVPRLLVGYSGGLDSSVLLHALAFAHPGRVRAIHVHHGLHADADAWAAHCQRTCDAWGVPLTIVRVQVVDVDAGPEAAARTARHKAFQAAMREGEWLALAHHRDDQAETFLLRALRGSGPDGLTAMRPLRAFGNGMMWRPLLELSRAMLHAYAQAHALEWVEDPSNQHSDYDRNFLRNEVLPLLRQRWPQADAAFARAAGWQRQVVTALQSSDADFAFAATTSPLPLTALRALPPLQRARAFRAWAVAQGLPPAPARVVDWLHAELAKPPGDGVAEYCWGGARLRRWRNALYPGEGIAPLPATLDIEWDGREAVVLPNGLHWALHGASGFDSPLRIRARQGGERMRLPNRTHRHLLKHALQDAGLPPWRRSALPLLFVPDGDLWAAGDLHAAGLVAWLKAHGATLKLTRKASPTT